jgi:hypothetical protein
MLNRTTDGAKEAVGQHGVVARLVQLLREAGASVQFTALVVLKNLVARTRTCRADAHTPISCV